MNEIPETQRERCLRHIVLPSGAHLVAVPATCNFISTPTTFLSNTPVSASHYSEVTYVDRRNSTSLSIAGLAILQHSNNLRIASHPLVQPDHSEHHQYVLQICSSGSCRSRAGRKRSLVHFIANAYRGHESEGSSGRLWQQLSVSWCEPALFRWRADGCRLFAASEIR